MNKDASPPSQKPNGSRGNYWKRNLRLVFILLSTWALVSFGCGIFFHRWLDQWMVPGTEFPVGFWFAQQGSILWFIVIVFVYAWRMNKLDHEFGVEED